MLHVSNNNNNGMTSLYEINILNQLIEWRKLLNTPIPQDLTSISPKKIVFVGIGSSYWMSRFAEFLWREYKVNTAAAAAAELLSVQSFDFVKSKYVVTHNDIVVVFSHRGTKTFRMMAFCLYCYYHNFQSHSTTIFLHFPEFYIQKLNTLIILKITFVIILL
jgi:hypothetical protein